MRHFIACVLVAACASPKPAPTKTETAAETRRSIFLFGNKVGYSILSTSADGTVTNSVDVHDNGRGPGANATMRLAPDGTLASLDVKGHTELNAPVEEHFALQNGHAAWKGLLEQGEKDVPGPAFYVPNSVTDADAFLLAALRKNGGTLQLLPGGTA